MRIHSHFDGISCRINVTSMGKVYMFNLMKEQASVVINDGSRPYSIWGIVDPPAEKPYEPYGASVDRSNLPQDNKFNEGINTVMISTQSKKSTYTFSMPNTSSDPAILPSADLMLYTFSNFLVLIDVSGFVITGGIISPGR